MKFSLRNISNLNGNIVDKESFQYLLQYTKRTLQKTGFHPCTMKCSYAQPPLTPMPIKINHKCNNNEYIKSLHCLLVTYNTHTLHILVNANKSLKKIVKQQNGLPEVLKHGLLPSHLHVWNIIITFNLRKCSGVSTFSHFNIKCDYHIRGNKIFLYSIFNALILRISFKWCTNKTCIIRTQPIWLEKAYQIFFLDFVKKTVYISLRKKSFLYFKFEIPHVFCITKRKKGIEVCISVFIVSLKAGIRSFSKVFP